MDKIKSILVIAGEHSGDELGEEILIQLKSKLKSMGPVKFYGTGGEKLAKQGVELIENINNMMVVGLLRILKSYKKLLNLIKNIIKITVTKKIKLAILIDYPGFNLKLAAKLKEKGIHIIFIVSPQIWAWHYSRIKTIKKNVDLMLTLFPFEAEIYKKENINSEFIGHPLIYRINKNILKEKTLNEFNLNKNKEIIGLLPGSRPSEIKALLPVMLETANVIYKKYPKYIFLIAGINKKMEEFILENLSKYPDLPIKYVYGSTYNVMKNSSMLLVASGTATLEAAYFRKPMVVVYITNWLTAIVGSIVVRVPYFCIVNVLAQKMIVPELFQTEVTVENLVKSLESFIKDKNYVKQINIELEKVIKNLEVENPAKIAAQKITQYIKTIKN